MRHCPRKNTPTGIGVNAATGTAVVHKMGCKSWACPYCSIKRKGFLVVKAYMGIETYKAAGVVDWFFGTITVHRRWRGPASVTNFKKNWGKFYQRMKRKTKGQLFYILLPEKHADGTLHVHIISTCQAETRWWKDNGAECGLGFINQNEPLVSTVKAAYYVTKYVGKAVGLSDWPADLRRVRFSIRWPKPEPDNSIMWQCVPPELAKQAVRNRLSMGYKIVNAITGEIVNVKAHSTDSRAGRVPDYDLSEKNWVFSQSSFASAARVGAPKDDSDVSV